MADNKMAKSQVKAGSRKRTASAEWKKRKGEGEGDFVLSFSTVLLALCSSPIALTLLLRALSSLLILLLPCAIRCLLSAIRHRLFVSAHCAIVFDIFRIPPLWFIFVRFK